MAFLTLSSNYFFASMLEPMIFVTMVGKARQYMAAQEQAKIAAISKKSSVRFTSTDEPPPTVQM